MGNSLQKERPKRRVVEIAFQGPRGVGKSFLLLRYVQVLFSFSFFFLIFIYYIYYFEGLISFS